MVKKLSLVALTLSLLACDQPTNDPKKCAALLIAKEVACERPDSQACKAAGIALVAAGCVTDTPSPTPTPTPVATPTPVPTPVATPTPVPTPLPTPTVPPTPQSYLPKQPAEGARVFLNNKKHGQGLDSTVRVYGDKEFCYAIHGVYDIECHLEGLANRVQAEMELINGCPIWQYRQPPDLTVRSCLQVGDDGKMSCDHFGSVEHRDDPITPAFEGQPIECGLQRDGRKNPMAGFWTVAHGKGQVRACRPDGDGCGPWVEVEH